MTHRNHLPQLDGDLFVTDGGIETTLIFHNGLDLPLFAAFDLLKDDEGTDAIRRYFEPYAELAAQNGTGFILESPTWRASPNWATELGYSNEELDGLNRKAISLMEEIRERHASSSGAPIVISGCIGPRGRRLQPGVEAQRRRGCGLPLDPDQDVRRHRGRHGHRGHDDLLGRSDRSSPRGGGRRHAFSHPFHR